MSTASGNVCSRSCWLYSIYETCKHNVFYQRKKLTTPYVFWPHCKSLWWKLWNINFRAGRMWTETLWSLNMNAHESHASLGSVHLGNCTNAWLNTLTEIVCHQICAILFQCYKKYVIICYINLRLWLNKTKKSF